MRVVAGQGTRSGGRRRRGDAGKRKRTNHFLYNQWQWWVIFSNFTRLELVEHLLRSSSKMVNLASKSEFGGSGVFGKFFVECG
jgi:hypothetical protein